MIASPPGMFALQNFVLIAHDGRGLFVRSNHLQPPPTLGTQLELTGTLRVDSRGATLTMGKNDTWTEQAGDGSDTSRIVDLLAPSEEDAWSLINVTGTIEMVHTSSMEILSNGVPLEVMLSPVTGLHAKTFKAQEEVVVEGILDINHSPLRIYPREASDITLIHTPSLATNTTSTSHPLSVPAWTPFGAVGAAIVVTEGVKKVKQKKQQRLATQLAEQATLSVKHTSQDLTKKPYV